MNPLRVEKACPRVKESYLFFLPLKVVGEMEEKEKIIKMKNV